MANCGAKIPMRQRGTEASKITDWSSWRGQFFRKPIQA
jgi:hypothetical protein